MKNLSLFQLSGASRKIIDDFMIDNNYKIYKVDFGKTPEHTIIIYKLQSCIIQYIECSFMNNQLFNICFTTIEK